MANSQSVDVASIPVVNRKNKFLEVSIIYNKETYNYFTGSSQRTGYYAHFTPVEIEKSPLGYSMRKYSIGGDEAGAKFFIEEGTRFNAKRLAKLAAELATTQDFKTQLLYIAARNGYELGGELGEIQKAHMREQGLIAA